MSTVEFTGERLIPGKVDVDLWNEHYSRYVFAALHCSGRRVLDAGCGAGYGAAEFAAGGALSVTSVDVAADALQLARAASPDYDHVQASAASLPFKPESFDLIACYEVIEHIPDWPNLITEAARVLAPGGLFFVSTPSIEFYAETRRESGPNPYHVHEFHYEEFEAALRDHFPHVTLFLQDHTEGIAFQPATQTNAGTDLRFSRQPGDPNDSNFFLSVCSNAPLPALGGLIYIPNAANALREKLRHIERLGGEIRKKDAWLAEQQQAHQTLLDQHHAQAAELASRHEWALSLESKLKQAGERIVALQNELAEQQQAALDVIAQHKEAYEKQIRQVEADLTAQLAAVAADRQARTDELVRCVEILHKTEADLEERTKWALDLDATRERLESELAAARAQLAAVQSSRWVKLGRAVGVGPELASR